MATPVAWETNIGWDFGFPSITDLYTTSYQYYFGVLGTDGNITVNAVAGGPVLGVIQDTGPAQTTVHAVGMRLGGPTKVMCGNSFNAGDLLSSDSSGRAVKYTGATIYTGTPYVVSGSQVLGVALSPGVSGDYVAMNFNPQGLAAAGLTA